MNSAAPTLDNRSVHLRRLLLTSLRAGVGAHIGPAFSVLEILRVLYDDILRYRPDDPGWPDRDRLILSKGHGALALYTMLADKGFFSPELLATFGSPTSPLAGHPERGSVPGVEATTGSLGHGLPVAVGKALATRRLASAPRIFVVVGDGELNEGSNWEALLHASKHKLDRLTVLVDRNGWQCNGRTDQVLPLGDLAAKFASFGVSVRTSGGHDVKGLRAVLRAVPFTPRRSSVVICDTVKGLGLPTDEDGPAQHHHAVGLTEESVQKMAAGLHAEGR